MAPPIRVGIVGLSTNSVSSWAALAHLPYLRASPAYEIAAVCNTTLASAHHAIQHFELPATTKAFDSVAALAAAPDIDLVVVSVRVQHHAAVVVPLLRAAVAKTVFCEWPLGVSAREARELAALAAERGVRTVVGTQARVSPAVVKLRELLWGADRVVGQVVSTDVVGSFGPRLQGWAAEALYFLEVGSGGSALQIRFGHFVDAFLYVLGGGAGGKSEAKGNGFARWHSTLVTNGKEVKIYDVPYSGLAKVIAEAPETASRVVRPTAPDEILLHGVLEGGAVASLHFGTGPSDPNGLGLRWLITGTEGTIEVTQPEGMGLLQSVGMKILVRRNGGEVEEVPVDWGLEGEWKQYGQMQIMANTGRLYKAWAEGKTEGLMDFEQAVKVHQLLDDMIELAEKESA